MKHSTYLALSSAFLIGLPLISHANPANNAAAIDRIQQLENELKTIKEQLNATVDKVEQNTQSGGNNKTYISGYGELHYNNLESDDGTKEKKEMDFHRFVLEFGHDFNERTRFFSELEVEHSLAGDGKPGEVELEQAYIEYDFNKNLSGRAGVMLVPVGTLNETHEPPTFFGVERNPVEKNIIPTTWWAGGVGITGKTDQGLGYDLMLHEGLNIPDSFSIRSGRQKTAKAKANNLAATGRIKYTGMPGVELALTAQQQNDFAQGEAHGGKSTLVETHATMKKGKVSAKALYAQWSLDSDAAKAASKDKQKGGYIELGYDITPKLATFVRHNQWDNGGEGDTTMKQTDIGVSYKVHKHAVLKADYQNQSGGDAISDSSVFDGFNLGVGYQF
jgi:hypothetical protein